MLIVDRVIGRITTSWSSSPIHTCFVWVFCIGAFRELFATIITCGSGWSRRTGTSLAHVWSRSRWLPLHGCSRHQWRDKWKCTGHGSDWLDRIGTSVEEGQRIRSRDQSECRRCNCVGWYQRQAVRQDAGHWYSAWEDWTNRRCQCH